MSPSDLLLADAEAHRRELVAFCYRYFASYPEAEDAVQETMLRAWQNADSFEGRASLRTWLHSIATNVCLDMKRAPQRRSLPMDLASPSHAPDDPSSLTTRPEATWVGPIADSQVIRGTDPAEVVVQRESIRLAFTAALQLLPPRQRVVLILRDVLAWSTQECADLLETTVPSVNSALARARRTVKDHHHSAGPRPVDYDEELLRSYVAAFEAFDVEALVELLAEDAVFSMPPYDLWLRGTEQIGRWWRGPGQICRNARTTITSANGQPAVAVYHDAGHRWEAFAIHVLDCVNGRISAITHFMGPAVFIQFGLPIEVTEAGRLP